MPVFDETNTRITVTKADGSKVVDGERKTEVTLQLPAGTEITVKVEVTTAAGEWRGSKDHTVTAGDNPITVTLSKTPKTMRNILIDVNADGNTVTLKQASGEKLLENIPIEQHHDVHPVIARDSIGRIYVLYRNKLSVTQTTHLRRIDVEGNGGTETGFHNKIVGALPPSTIDTITNMAIDVKHNYIFLFRGMTVYCLKEKEDHSFEYIVQGSFPIPAATPLNVTAAAVYDDVLFVVDGTTLYACKFKIEGLPGHPGRKQLQFKPVGSDAASLNLPKLRTDSAFSNNLTKCTGLFADESGVYCLLSENSIAWNRYMVGSVVQCVYKNDGSLEQKGEPKGLNPKAGGTDTVITFDAQYFSNPVGFIGSDEDNLYIADDGVDFEDINENWHVKTHHNRIAAFNRKSETGSLTFTSANARWYSEVSPYKIPNTPVLLWEKYQGTEHPVPYQGMRYWTSADGTEAFSESNKLFEITDTASEGPTDVFCYDQDGNLYILWQDSSNDYRVRRFELKNGASYAATGEDSPALDSSLLTPSYIAVDISGWQNYLYCGYKDITNDWKVERMSWIGNLITLTPLHAEWSITVGSDSSKKLTALAANKDGVFVAVKETYQDGSIEKYRLKVQKYSKETGAAAQGKIMVDNSVTVGVRPAASPYNDYTEADTSITGLQVVEEQLYAIAATEERLHKYKSDIPDYVVDVFKHSSVLYKLPKTNDTFSGSIAAENSHKKNAGDEIGYGFCRFIAVKPKKLVIASDSGWGKDGLVGGHWDNDKNNTDTVLEFDLKNNVFGTDKKAGGTFSKKLVESGFDWD